MFCFFSTPTLHSHPKPLPPTGNYACSTTADTSVPIPIGDGYISGLKVAVAKVGPPYVGKLVVSVTPRGGGWPATYTCGSGGGLPVTLLSPLQALLLYDSRVGCVGAPASGGGRRRRASSATALNVSSLLLEVALRPVAADAPVPTLLLNGVPVAGEVPTPTPSSPTVTPSTASRAINSAAALIITGSGFDAAAAGNAVTLSLDAVGNVTSATSNRLDVTLTTAPTSVGSLTAIVTSFGVSSGPAVQVATVVAPPTVVVNTSSRALDAPTLVIAGTGFDASTPSANVVALSSGNGTVTGATPTSLTVAFSSPPSLGDLTAVVTSFGGASGAAVQVATVVAAPTVVVNTSNLAQDAPTLVIAGTGFDASTPSANVVALSSGNGTVTGATPTSLTVAFSSPPSLGNLTAVVTSFGGASDAPVQVAIVVAAPTVVVNTSSLAQDAPTLVIAGTGFDASTPSANVVALSSGNGTVTGATPTSLTVAFSSPPSLGNLTAVVTSFGGASGAAVQVATVVAAPTVVVNTSSRAQDAPTLVIAGTGFDASTPSANVVALSSGNGTVTGATPTSLTVAFSSPPSLGNLTAVVTSFGGASVAPVQVATVVAAPTVVVNTSSRAQDAPTLVIAGTGFDASTPSANVVALSSGNGTLTGATPTSLTVAFSSPPSLGDLTAVVTSFGGASGAAVQVATVVAAPTVVVNTSNLAQDAPTLVIAGTGFDASTASANVVALSSGNGTVTGATPTSLTVAFSSPPSLGNLTAVVTSFDGASDAAVQVATVVAAPAVVVNTSNLAQDAPTLVIAGTGFDASTPSANVVALSSGNGTVTGATPTSLTVAFSSPPSLGNLTAVVTSFGGASVAPVQVATVVAAPTVVVNTSSRAQDAPTLVIAGTGFDASTPSANVVALSSGNGTVTGATPTSLTVAFSSPPSLGDLTAVVTSFGGASGSPVQVAYILGIPTVMPSAAGRAVSAPTLVITGTNFDPTASGNLVVLNLGAAGTVTSATATQVTVTLTAAPTSIGVLTAVVNTTGGTSGNPVQVATVVNPPTVTPSAQNVYGTIILSPSFTIAGTGFDTTASANSVTLNLGALVTVASATANELTVLISTPPNGAGALTAVVTKFGVSSGAPVQVATVPEFDCTHTRGDYLNYTSTFLTPITFTGGTIIGGGGGAGSASIEYIYWRGGSSGGGGGSSAVLVNGQLIQSASGGSGGYEKLDRPVQGCDPTRIILGQDGFSKTVPAFTLQPGSNLVLYVGGGGGAGGTACGGAGGAGYYGGGGGGGAAISANGLDCTVKSSGGGGGSTSGGVAGGYEPSYFIEPTPGVGGGALGGAGGKGAYEKRYSYDDNNRAYGGSGRDGGRAGTSNSAGNKKFGLFQYIGCCGGGGGGALGGGKILEWLVL